jgi:molybdopterin synthase catalytic subunit
VLERSRIAVDQEFADDAAPLRDGAEVAIVPPVAGGSDGGPLRAPARARISETPLALAEVVDRVSATGRGGIVTFTGTVRDLSHGNAVVRLEYEAYVPMAVAKLEAIAAEVGARHGAEVAVVHRVGVLPPGEAAVVIAAAAPHRQPAFRACEETIERLKQEVPIWKREVYADGEAWVGMGP